LLKTPVRPSASIQIEKNSMPTTGAIEDQPLRDLTRLHENDGSDGQTLGYFIGGFNSHHNAPDRASESLPPRSPG
jgi:hypothetical protein